MKPFRLFAAFSCAMITACYLAVGVFAANNTLIPYEDNAPAAVTAAPSTADVQVTTSTNFFDSTSYLGEPPSDAVTGVTSFMADCTTKVVQVAFAIFPMLLVIQFIVDVFCILFHPINLFFAKIVPIRVYSKEVETITGVTFSSSTGETATTEGSSGTVDLKGKRPIKYYLATRVKLYVFGVIVLILVSTGLWSSIINLIANTIVGWLTGMGL